MHVIAPVVRTLHDQPSWTAAVKFNRVASACYLLYALFRSARSGELLGLSHSFHAFGFLALLIEQSCTI